MKLAVFEQSGGLEEGMSAREAQMPFAAGLDTVLELPRIEKRAEAAARERPQRKLPVPYRQERDAYTGRGWTDELPPLEVDRRTDAAVRDRRPRQHQPQPQFYRRQEEPLIAQPVSAAAAAASYWDNHRTWQHDDHSTDTSASPDCRRLEIIRYPFLPPTQRRPEKLMQFPDGRNIKPNEYELTGNALRAMLAAGLALLPGNGLADDSSSGNVGSLESSGFGTGLGLASGAGSGYRSTAFDLALEKERRSNGSGQHY